MDNFQKLLRRQQRLLVKLQALRRQIEQAAPLSFRLQQALRQLPKEVQPEIVEVFKQDRDVLCLLKLPTILNSAVLLWAVGNPNTNRGLGPGSENEFCYFGIGQYRRMSGFTLYDADNPSAELRSALLVHCQTKQVSKLFCHCRQDRGRGLMYSESVRCYDIRSFSAVLSDDYGQKDISRSCCYFRWYDWDVFDQA